MGYEAETDSNIESVLEKLDVVLRFTPVRQRPDDLLDCWGDGAHHYLCVLTKGDEAMPFYYSMGSACKGHPKLGDVMYSLLLDVTVLDFDTFGEWAREYDCDEDSRRAERFYIACLAQARQFTRLFDERDRAHLQELFQDY